MLRNSAIPRSIWPLITKHSTREAYYATVSPSILNFGSPPPPVGPAINASSNIPSLLDRRILAAAASAKSPTLSDLARSYMNNSGHVLDVSLLYESRPSAGRRVNRESSSVNSPDVLLVAHCIQDGGEHKVTVSSGFALEAPAPREGESLIVSCAHTFEEIRRSPIILESSTSHLTTPRRTISGSFVISSEGTIYPVTDIVSCLPRSDLMIMTCKKPPVATLPVSPYPAHPQTRVLGHLVSHQTPTESGWSPWIGNTWRKWARGTVWGYRDFAGRETIPGTYDALSHLLFSPLPTAGSSGGPIIDEETGAVIGVMLGTRMYNRVEGTRGWGVPSETIFEMFSLPGLEGKK